MDKTIHYVIKISFYTRFEFDKSYEDQNEVALGV